MGSGESAGRAWGGESVASLVLAVAAVVLSAVLAFRDMPPPAPTKPVDAGPEASIDAGAPVDAGTIEPVVFGADAGGLFLSDLRVEPPREMEAGALPDRAPNQVRFGVVLVQFAGVQGAPASARSRADAAAAAERLAEEARTDFRAAVRKGDPGSTEDAGRIHRGILEPASEIALFGLAVGDTSGPVETPRGYWIVKRLE